MFAVGICAAQSDVSFEFRDGAIICAADPVSGTQQVYLPAVYAISTQQIINPEGRTGLVYYPLKLNLAGGIIQRAEFRERVLPEQVLTTYKNLPAAETAIVLRQRNGELHLKENIETNWDEASKILTIETAKKNEPSKSDIQRTYEQRWALQAQNTLTFAEGYSDFQADIPVDALSKLNSLSPSEIFSVVEIPARFENRVERILTSPPKLDRHTYACNGHQLTWVSPTPSDYYSRTPVEFVTLNRRVMTRPPQYLFFNSNGERMDADRLSDAGYNGLTVSLARNSDKLLNSNNQAE